MMQSRAPCQRVRGEIPVRQGQSQCHPVCHGQSQCQCPFYSARFHSIFQETHARGSCSLSLSLAACAFNLE